MPSLSGVLLSAAACLVASASLFGEEPDLPEGLGGSDEPSLPSGLDEASGPVLPEGLSAGEPSLPGGLGEAEAQAPAGKLESADTPSPVHWTFRGFAEARAGVWTESNPVEPDFPIAEARLQSSASAHYRSLSAQATVDLVADPLPGSQRLELREGKGPLDLRELWFSAPLGEWGNLKAGRQVSTWGTGDYLFINDLFPKDWRSFFLGRDDEYLKAPADALRLTTYSSFANLDLVYTPRFMPDRFISGERLSYFDGMSGTIVGEGRVTDPDLPGGGELALRVYRLFGDAEVAAYFYEGYWKSPAGQSEAGRPIFPELRVFGASVRKPLLGGIAHAEVGYYDSLDDADGSDPALRNSEYRFLLGFERELAREFTGSLQWYVERIQDYPAYLDSLPPGTPQSDRTRQVLTLRLTRFLMMQDLELSLFAFYSPTDEDAYIRPSIGYRIDDHWEITAGGNVLTGESKDTFFGQFEKNTNLFGSLRFSF